MPNEPLRIAMFTDSALPILNGVSISVDALIGELRNQGHSVHLYCNRYPGRVDPDPNTFRFRAVEFPLWPGYPLPLPPFIRMLQKFRRHQYDVIHTHTPFLNGMVALRWAESHEIPIVSTYHTLYDRYAHYVKLLPYRYVRFRIAKHTNYYYNRATHVITPSEAALKWLRRHSVESPISVIPTGSPRPGLFDRSQVRHELGIAPETKLLLYVGRLAREKNLLMLLESAASAFKIDPSLRLWLVGDGPFRAECVAKVRSLGIGDRVKFVGFVPRTDVDRYYAAADLFVFPSFTETQGLVVQEAMQFGLPAVVVAGGGAGEAVEEGVNGCHVRNDVRDFASAVVGIMGDEHLYTRMSAEARRSGRGAGIGTMAERVVNVYREAIDGYQLEPMPARFARLG